MASYIRGPYRSKHTSRARTLLTGLNQGNNRTIKVTDEESRSLRAIIYREAGIMGLRVKTKVSQGLITVYAI